MKLPSNVLKKNSPFSPCRTPNHFKHILQRDAAFYRFVGPWLWHPAWLHLLILTGWQVHITSHQEVMQMTDLALST